MMRRHFLVGLAVVASLAVSSTTRGAPVIGSQTLFADGATIDTADLELATTFDLVDPTTGLGSGDFFPLGLSGLPLTSVTLTLPYVAGSFTLSNTEWGTFIADSLMEIPSGPGIRSFYLLGDFTPGTSTDWPAGASVGEASLTMSFTQTGGPGSVVSWSATLASPPAPPPAGVPEPGSLALAISAIAALGVVRVLRSRAE